jgi:hypothetical protein
MESEISKIFRVGTLCLAALIAQLIGCEARDDTVSTAATRAAATFIADPRQMSTERVYLYSAYHATDLAVVEGTLAFSLDVSGRVSGRWTTRRTDVEPSIDVGPQVGTGTLEGEVERDGRLVLRTTSIADYEVLIVCESSSGDMRGHWQYRNDAGVAASGRFVATEK